MRGIRWFAAAVVGAAVATTLTGCGAGSWCSPLEPGPSVTAEYAPTADRLEAVSGVREVTARYWQPDDSHCVSRKYLATAAWSADFTVRVRAGFTLEQVNAVRVALGSSRGTVAAAAGDGLTAWRLTLANPSGAAPGVPLLVDEQGYQLVTEAAALPDVSVAEQDSSTTVRVRTPASMRTAVAWLREHADAADGAWVSVGTRHRSSASVAVAGSSGVSDTTVTTTAEILSQHPDLRDISVGNMLVIGVAPTKRQARQVVAAYERTPADSPGQEVAIYWPDGDGSKEAGKVGSAR